MHVIYSPKIEVLLLVFFDYYVMKKYGGVEVSVFNIEATWWCVTS